VLVFARLRRCRLLRGCVLPYYRRVGEIPRKRHQIFRDEQGNLIFEELMGKEGFAAESSLLYHMRPPTAIVEVESVTGDLEEQLHTNAPLLPRHFKTGLLSGKGGDSNLDRRVLLGNDEIKVGFVSSDTPSVLYRNALGDECLFVVRGEGQIQSVFGSLEIKSGDYVLIPASTTFKVVPTGSGYLDLLTVEAKGHIEFPKRYLTARGQFLESAPLCERDLVGPELPLVLEGEDVDVYVKHRGGITRYFYSSHPFDVVGWDGCLYPFVFSIYDFEPIVKRFHAPPPVHQVFEGNGFVVCSFLPRPYDFDPTAVPAPYSHANVDSDEVLFYYKGDFMSRRGSGIEEGSISLHPAGFIHGPQPGSVEASLEAKGTEEVAVMIDTFNPLRIGDAAYLIEDSGYPWSWSKRHGLSDR